MQKTEIRSFAVPIFLAIVGGIAGMLLSLPLYVCARGAVRALQCAARENAP